MYLHLYFPSLAFRRQENIIETSCLVLFINIVMFMSKATKGLEPTCPAMGESADITLTLALTWALNKHTESIVNNLSGKVLTLADASFTDPVQRKAFKDLIRQMAFPTYGDLDRSNAELAELVGEVVGDREPMQTMSSQQAELSSCFDKITHEYK